MTEASAEEHKAIFERLCTDISEKRHLIVATNRGPVSFRATETGQPAPSASGGMGVAGLDPFRGQVPLTWLSLAANDADIAALGGNDRGIYTGQPLPDRWAVRFASAPRRVAHRHYNLICNPFLWFLHHRTWGPSHTPNVDDTVVDAWNNGHVPVTLQYASAIEEEARISAKPILLNTRDYTLPLLPGLVRASVPGALILHSSDVPWPGPDWWLLLPRPWRESIFKSLLSCDGIAFPTGRDLRAFATCAIEFVPGTAHSSDGSLTLGGHKVALAVSRTGIDASALREFAGSKRVADQLRRLGVAEGIHKFVIADRAEPHKNIVRSLRAYRRLLERDRGLIGRVQFVLVLAPPPPQIGLHRRYVDEIKAEVRDIERDFRKTGWNPVSLHLERNFAMVAAALTIYDTLVSVPIADEAAGVAFDGPFINKVGGDLILSETSPASEVMDGPATIVSPADIEGLSAMMARSVLRIPAERKAQAEELARLASRQTRESAIATEFMAISGRL